MEFEKKIENETDVEMVYGYLKCPCCDNYFYDKLRALLLKCGHNICNKCLEINKSAYTCLICLSNNKEEDLKDLSINFLLDEMIIKLITSKIIDISKTEINEKYQFYCVNCKTLMFSSKFHNKLHNTHRIIDYENFKKTQIDFYKKLKEDFMSDYGRRIAKLQDNMGGFTDLISTQLSNSLDDQINVLKRENADNLEALRVIDLISEEEFNKLKFFKEVFVKNEESTNKLLDDRNNLSDDSKIKFEKLFKNVLDVEQIFSQKLSNIDLKLNEINNNLNEIDPNKFSDDLAFEISNNLKSAIYSDANKNKYNSIITFFKNKNLFLFDTILCEENIFSFQNSEIEKYFEISNFLKEICELTDFTITTDELDGIFIIGGKKSETENFSNKVFLLKKSENDKYLIESYPSMTTNRSGHIAIHFDFKIFVFGGTYNPTSPTTSCEYYDIISGYWLELQNIPVEYVKDSARCVVANNRIYFLDGLKNLYFLEMNKDDNNSVKDGKWQEIKIFYDNSYDLNLKHFSLIGNYVKKVNNILKLIILGGEFDTNFNDNVFSLTIDEKMTVLKKETELKGFKFKFQKQSTNNFNEDCDYCYLIGDDNEKISVFKVFESLDIEEIKLFNK